MAALSRTSKRHLTTIGLRREDPSRIWERRCPLTPDAVHDLVHNENAIVLVQNCERRVFPINEFLKAGAQLRENLSPAHIILGIKEVPLPELLTSPLSSPVLPQRIPRTHLMFSHTTKGQPYNLPLLSRFFRSNNNVDVPLPRLIDYEMLTDKNGKRTVGFGWFAGVAGALESFSAMAHYHLELGVMSPFLYTPRPHTHPSLTTLRASLKDIGTRIATEGTPKSLGPFVLGLSGTGNVAQGVLSIIKELPIVNVKVEDLHVLVSDPNTDLHKIYFVHALPRDYLLRNDGKMYDRADYYANPSLYRSEFHTRVAPYLTLFLNGAGWSPSFPRLMSNEQLATALSRSQAFGKARFTNIGDISCDVEGGLEFLTRSSTLSSPFYKTRPIGLPAHLPSVQMMAVDILPASIPLDASKHFSEVLLPYVKTLIHEYRGEQPVDNEHMRALDRATVAKGGELTVQHRWLAEPVQAWRESAELQPETFSRMRTEASPGSGYSGSLAFNTIPKKKVLMLGSGMVAAPAVDEICKRPDVELLVASNSRAEADSLTHYHENARSHLVDVSDQEKVGRLVEHADVVISLLPVHFHPSVAELCIKYHKHLVTASYISPAMRALHDKALSADVLLLNEIGLDPGIDHCSAIGLVSKLREQNKRIISFTSFCGGLPSPECADLPLGYKFSWSPRGVLSAALNDAKFKLDGKDWEIPGQHVLHWRFPDVPISNVLKLEGIANRDSFPYAESYQLGDRKDLRTLLRGTLRYPGFSELMHSFKSIGLLQTSSLITLSRWESLPRLSLETLIGVRLDDDNPASVRSAIRDLVAPSQVEALVHALDWLLSPGSLPQPPTIPAAPIDHFSVLLAQRLRYEPNERDMVILHHEIVANGGSGEEVHTSSLMTYGTLTGSAMSRCVGLPIAFATLRVLDGGVSVRGVTGPTDKSIYDNVLTNLQEIGLGMKETVKRGVGMEDTLLSGLTSCCSVTS